MLLAQALADDGLRVLVLTNFDGSWRRPIGQGLLEYGHIARPEIFGSKPYSYGRGGSSSDNNYLAKHYNDLILQEQKRQLAAAASASSGQIVPRRGVAPASLNGGVQPYNSEIHC